MIIQDQTFNKIEFDNKMLSKDGYDNCEFIDCTFSSADFADVSFMECKFKVCNFSMAKMDNAGIKDVSFFGCNFMGVDLSVCSQFLWKAMFEECQMDLIIAKEMKLKGVQFINCSLKEADFTQSDLTLATFENCNLERAIFHRTNLEKTDFTNALNYSLDPSDNILKKTIFSSSGVRGLLTPFDIIIQD